MSTNLRNTMIFFIFFISGFCGLLYQVIWIRLAYASFGINTSVLSVIISIFMLGLAVGSWLGGKWIFSLTTKTGQSGIFFYALAELMIGVGAFLVPKLFRIGETLLLPYGETSSFFYLVLTALAIALSISPWCIAMGTTFPFMMAFLRQIEQSRKTTFSFLYLANVLGALFGIFLTVVVLVELLGFHRTLAVAATANLAIAAVSIFLGRLFPDRKPLDEFLPDPRPMESSKDSVGLSTPGRVIFAILFLTGFSSMGMEVLWTRAFTVVLKTEVYSFALIIFFYLSGTFVGTALYRRHLRTGKIASVSRLFILTSLASLGPVVLNDPRLGLGIAGIAASILAFCGALGYLTPRIIDEYCAGHPEGAGRAYAINVIGCILGPIVTSYLVLPVAGARLGMVILSVPFFLFLIHFLSLPSLSSPWKWTAGGASAALLVCSLFVNISYEDGSQYADKVIRRDHTATVISAGTGFNRILLVNGVGITVLHPVTKLMAHLPLALHSGNPKSVLVICFGMGTTFRSSLSWGMDTTAVDLSPSVIEAFGYYHEDADELLRSPLAHPVVDDGRRFLRRVNRKFDVITIDPPPPAETAGSGLLYSREFYEAAKMRLSRDGILQQWYPGQADQNLKAILRSITEAFPYVVVFHSIANTGYHLLGSLEPIRLITPEEFAGRMPAAAQKDFMEWPISDSPDIAYNINLVLQQVRGYEGFLSPSRKVVITDDLPYNEYFLLRNTFMNNP